MIWWEGQHGQKVSPIFFRSIFAPTHQCNCRLLIFVSVPLLKLQYHLTEKDHQEASLHRSPKFSVPSYVCTFVCVLCVSVGKINTNSYIRHLHIMVLLPSPSPDFPSTWPPPSMPSSMPQPIRLNGKCRCWQQQQLVRIVIVNMACYSFYHGGASCLCEKNQLQFAQNQFLLDYSLSRSSFVFLPKLIDPSIKCLHRSPTIARKLFGPG